MKIRFIKHDKDAITEEERTVITQEEFDSYVFDILEELTERFSNSDMPVIVADAVCSIVARGYSAMYQKLFGGRGNHYAD